MKRFFLYHVRLGLDAGLLGFMEANAFLHSFRWAIFPSRVTALIGSVFFPSTHMRWIPWLRLAASFVGQPELEDMRSGNVYTE